MMLRHAILRSAACLVPRRRRADWLAEWRAELCYVTHRETAFCLGAFADAFWLRRRAMAAGARAMLRMKSPLGCLALLAPLGAAGAYVTFHLPLLRQLTPGPADFLPLWVLAPYGLLALVALAILFATTSLASGRYPGGCRLRRGLFLLAKIALLLPVVLGCSLAIPQVFLVGEILALRWAFADQHGRCPICLHRLACPTRIGDPSHAFLDWYGTEFICGQGHGMLYSPEILTSCYPARRWQSLDPSWSSLFS